MCDVLCAMQVSLLLALTYSVSLTGAVKRGSGVGGGSDAGSEQK